MKSILPVFRCLSTLERNVEKCHLHINFNTCHLVFQFLCKHGLTKTHNLAYEDHEPLQAVFSKTTCPNVLKIQSRVFSDILIHFPTSQEEVTVIATPLKISFRSYSEEELGFSKVMLTEIQLSPDEFDYFQIGVDTEITFCLKEVRGLLSFAETTSALISIHFSKSGQPVVFSMDDMLFEANFILATLADVEDSTSSQLSCGTVFDSVPYFLEPFHQSSKISVIGHSAAWQQLVKMRMMDSAENSPRHSNNAEGLCNIMQISNMCKILLQPDIDFHLFSTGHICKLSGKLQSGWICQQFGQFYANCGKTRAAAILVFPPSGINTCSIFLKYARVAYKPRPINADV